MRAMPSTLVPSAVPIKPGGTHRDHRGVVGEQKRACGCEMPNDEIQLNQERRDLLVAELQVEFTEAETLRHWVRDHFRFSLVDNILVSAPLKGKVTDLVDWAEAHGHLADLLQSLCDHPPEVSRHHRADRQPAVRRRHQAEQRRPPYLEWC